MNCKYSEATTKAGHPVDSHCVILVRVLSAHLSRSHAVFVTTDSVVSSACLHWPHSFVTVLLLSWKRPAFRFGSWIGPILAIRSVGCLQDLAGLRLNMLNQNTIKVFKSMAGVYQDHYPVSGTFSAACMLLLMRICSEVLTEKYGPVIEHTLSLRSCTHASMSSLIHPNPNASILKVIGASWHSSTMHASKTAFVINQS